MFEDNAANADLERAATDLLTALLKREDQEQWLKISGDGKPVTDKIRDIFWCIGQIPISFAASNMNLLAKKTGIAYAAVLNYFVDIARDNTWNSNLVAAVVRGGANILGAFVGIAILLPAAMTTGMSQIVRSAGDVTAVAMEEFLKKDGERENMVNSICSNFDINVLYLAKQGVFNRQDG